MTWAGGCEFSDPLEDLLGSPEAAERLRDELPEDWHEGQPTVRNYMSNAISKMGARNRIETIRICKEAGWI